MSRRQLASLGIRPITENLSCGDTVDIDENTARERSIVPADLPQIPVAPGRLPVIGHLWSVARDQPGFTRRAREAAGPLYWFELGGGNWQVMVHGAPGRELIRNRTTRSKIVVEETAFILRDTVLALDGDEHRRVRGAMTQAFSPRGLTQAGVGEVLAEIVERRLSTWSGYRRLPIAQETNRIALELIFRVMGVPTHDLERWRVEYRRWLLGAAPLPKWLPGGPHRRAMRAGEWLTGRLQAYIDEARTRGDCESVLGAMVQRTGTTDKGLSPDELVSNLRLLGLVGHETSAHATAWMFLLLARHPSAWDRLVEEAEGTPVVPCTAADLVHFPYAEAAFREGLRLYPPTNSLSRKVEGRLEAHGVVIPHGTTVTVSLTDLSWEDGDYEDRMAFRPERWFERDRRPGPAESIQFGSGVHFCLGYHLALLTGVHFAVQVARALSDAGLRPRIAGEMPKPVYFPFPLTRPRSNTRVDLVARA